jgi:hypothetical protein
MASIHKQPQRHAPRLKAFSGRLQTAAHARLFPRGLPRSQGGRCGAALSGTGKFENRRRWRALRHHAGSNHDPSLALPAAAAVPRSLRSQRKGPRGGYPASSTQIGKLPMTSRGPVPDDDVIHWDLSEGWGAQVPASPATSAIPCRPSIILRQEPKANRCPSRHLECQTSSIQM